MVQRVNFVKVGKVPLPRWRRGEGGEESCCFFATPTVEFKHRVSLDLEDHREQLYILMTVS